MGIGNFLGAGETLVMIMNPLLGFHEAANNAVDSGGDGDKVSRHLAKLLSGRVWSGIGDGEQTSSSHFEMHQSRVA